MSSGSRDAGGPPATGADAGASVRWHHSRAGDQVVLAVESRGVRLAVAFPADASRRSVLAALDERDRELRHYLRLRGDAGDS